MLSSRTGAADQQRHEDRLAAETEMRPRSSWVAEALEERATVRFQPSTRMKIRILNGSEMRIGGIIIMPIESRMLAVTISMTMNGT